MIFCLSLLIDDILSFIIAESYLGPFQISMMEFLWEREQLKAVSYFHKNAPSRMFDAVLNTPLYWEVFAYSGIT